MTKIFKVRKFFRLLFPISERPTLQIGGRSFKVVEISEGGCKTAGGAAASDVLGGLGADVTGFIELSDGDRIDVSGKILRLDADDSVAITFDNGPTFAKMMGVHRAIIAKYSV